MKFILGKKIEMTQRFADDGAVTPVTAIQAGPCVVTQVKNTDTDGYTAVQVGFGTKRKPNKAEAGRSSDKKQVPQSYREFRVEDAGDLKQGDVITVGVFAPGDSVQISGNSKGKGFQGVVRRHGFKGGKGSHGDKDQLRMPGSVGATDPARVFKGTRMGGQMGGTNVTTKGLSIVEIDAENNLLYVKGAVPGSRNSLVLISGEGEMKLVEPETPQKEATSTEETKADTASETTDHAPAEKKPEETPATPEKSVPEKKSDDTEKKESAENK